MTPAHVSVSNRRLGDMGPKLMGGAAFVGVAGLAASVAFAMSGAGWERFLRSYLTAFMFVLSICLGGLFFTVLQHCVKAGWSVALRRIAEGVASNLQWIWILFLPIAWGMQKGMLYDWVEHPGTADKYKYYLYPNFWLIRAGAFFFIWAMVSRFFVGNSIRQDATGDINITRKMERFAPVSMILFALTQSFAAMDWIMSLESHWFSTMFPVYFFAASCCGYFAVQILLMTFLHRSGRLASDLTAEHFQDAGKLLFAFGIVFWAYIAFSQYMLIWYASLPEETTWYMTRQMGGWGVVILALLFGHFLGPFLALISRHPKRIRNVLAAGAMWMVAIHYVDIYWLVMPKVPEAIEHTKDYGISSADFAAAVGDPQGAVAQRLRHLDKETTEELFSVAKLDNGYGWSLLDFTCLIGLAGLVLAGTARTLGGCALLPERDPRLHESLAFENI